MKRIIISLLLLLSLFVNVFAMTACDFLGNGSGTVSDEVVAYDGSQVTITFSHTMGQNLRGILDYYITEFNKIYPNITIEHSQVGGYDDLRDTIKTQLTSNNQPNIAYCYPDHVALYLKSYAVASLDGFINSTDVVTKADGTTEVMGLTAEQKADFIEGYYAEGAVFDTEGTMYTLPMAKSTEVIFYNADVFEKHGLSVPTTWAEMESVCDFLKKEYPNSTPLGYDSEANWFITMCEQYGSGYTSTDSSNHFLFDNETNRGFVKMFREWREKGYVTTQKIYGSYTSKLFTSQDDAKCFMVIGSTGGSGNQSPAQVDGEYPFSVGVAPIPQVNPNAPKVISQGPSLCIFKDSNPQEVAASWLFVKFLTTSVAFQAEFSMASGYAPVIKSVQKNDVYANFLTQANGTTRLTALACKIALEQDDAYFVSPAFVGSSTARDWAGKIMQNVLGAEDIDVDAYIDEQFKKAMADCEYAARGN